MLDSFEPSSKYAQVLIGIELSVIACVLFVQFSKELIARGEDERRFKVSASVPLLMVAALCGLALNSFFGGGRPVLAVGVVMPGSAAVRFLPVNIDAWLRRLLEPALLGYLAVLTLLYSFSTCRCSRMLYQASLFLILGFHFVEVLLLFPGTREGLARAGLLDFACLLQTSALQAALLAQLLGGGFAIKARNVLERADTGPRAAGKKVALLFVMIAGFGAMLRIVQSGVLLSPKPLTGAHYYSWFPENWVAGYSGREMLPPVLPALGEYDSGNRAVFEQHVAWAKRAGVGFLVFDWWAQRTSIDRRIRSNIEHLRPDSGMQFSLMYESLELKQSSKGASSAEPSNVVYMTRQRAWEMRRHWTYLARTFMAHPSYLKFENRPVLFVYATRHLVGPVAEAVQEARQHVKEKTGLDLYLVGDEVFFNVVSLDRTGKIVLLPELQPDWDRLNAFDALTAYNPYDSTRTQYAGQSGADIFLTDVENLYRRYRGICAAAGIRFFPGVLPGYNDRALRPKEDHYVVPRKIGPDRAQDFFAASISRWAMTLLDQSLPVMLVTSWNEWNEGTQIEPALKSPPTDRDRSESGTAVSQGEHHEGYGEYYLKMLRNPLN